MASRWFATVVDAQDPKRLALWWAEVLGYHVLFEGPTEIAIGGDGSPGLVFVDGASRSRTVSLVAAAGEAVKNRLRIELDADDQDAEIERLVNMGARHVGVGNGREAPGEAVLADPEGNEFCVLPPRASETGFPAPA
ncbi:MAG: VOC family protein [Stackebrandtia sp.]